MRLRPSELPPSIVLALSLSPLCRGWPSCGSGLGDTPLTHPPAGRVVVFPAVTEVSLSSHFPPPSVLPSRCQQRLHESVSTGSVASVSPFLSGSWRLHVRGSTAGWWGVSHHIILGMCVLYKGRLRECDNQLPYLKSFHLKGGLYLSRVVPESRTRISERELQGSSFQFTARNGPLST